jgi:molybdopterin converting factor small subunit
MGAMPAPVVVTVLLFAALRDRAGRDRCEIALPAGARIGDIWPVLPAPLRRNTAPAGVRYARNDEWAAPETPIASGDRIAVLLPVSGG